MTRVKEASEKMTYLIARVLRNPHLYLIAVMVALLAVIHFYDAFPEIPSLRWIGSVLGLGLGRHTLERILFLVPVIYAAATLGVGGGASTLVLVAAIMLPRVFLISPETREALFETGGVIFTGAVMVAFLHEFKKGKQRLAELEKMQSTLNLQIKRLGMLHVISSIVSQSLELPQVLTAARDRVKQIMEVDSVWLYLWNEDERKLRLACANGLPDKVLPETTVPGEGLDGVAAQSRQPILVQKVSANPALRSVLPASLQSVLSVPLIIKSKMMGTLGAGTFLLHQFSPDDVDLLQAIGNQIAMAIENSRLYQSERLAAEALRISEKNYRELFENASDAIWVHDLNGKILAANSAFEKLVGHDRDTLVGANVSTFLTPHGLTKIDREVHDHVLRGEAVEPYEQELIKKDGNSVIVQIGTSLIAREEEPWAFQHIARDITEEKTVQENLRLYVHQVSQAQEAERKRIARELHDETAQALIAILRNLDDLSSGNSRLSVQDIRTEVKSVLQGVRRFSQELRPSILDDLGLLPAVNWLASDLKENYGIVANTEVAGIPRQLPPEVELMVFRIVQEALANVRRHSEANSVTIRVEFTKESTRIVVSDNGKGFEAPERLGDLARSGKLGLAGMQERVQLLGGTLTLHSEAGKGTTVTVEIPL